MKNLNTMHLQEKEVSLHKKALKYELLRQYSGEMNQQANFMKGGELLMKHKILSIGFAGLIIGAVVFGFSVLSNQPLTPQAEAKEAVEKAFAKFTRLSTEEQANLEQKIKADMETSLEEAKNAKDLEIVSEDEITRFTAPQDVEGQPMMTFKAEKVMVHDENGEASETVGEQGVAIGMGVGESEPGVRVAEEGKVMAPEGLKVLRYTDPKGRETILGINDQDEAVMKMIKLSPEDMKQMKVITPENAEEHGFSTSPVDNFEWSTQ